MLLHSFQIAVKSARVDAIVMLLVRMTLVQMQFNVSVTLVIQIRVLVRPSSAQVTDIKETKVLTD